MPENRPSSQSVILPIPILDSLARFTLLYFTTLFSLDPWTAAANSPFSLLSSNIAEAEARRRGGRTTNSGAYRLDPGGDTSNRRGGFGGGGSGRSINATPCPSCATPNVEIHQ